MWSPVSSCLYLHLITLVSVCHQLSPPLSVSSINRMVNVKQLTVFTTCSLCCSWHRKTQMLLFFSCGCSDRSPVERRLWSFGTICSKSVRDVYNASSNFKAHSAVSTQGPGLHQFWRKDKKQDTAQKHVFNENMKEARWWEAATFFRLLSLKPTLIFINPTLLSGSWSALQRRLHCASVLGSTLRARECHASLAHFSATNSLGSMILRCLITAVCFLLYVAGLFRDSVGQLSVREALDASVAPNHWWLITKSSPFTERRANSHI